VKNKERWNVPLLLVFYILKDHPNREKLWRPLLMVVDGHCSRWYTNYGIGDELQIASTAVNHFTIASIVLLFLE
jgi:hypothetical protein